MNESSDGAHELVERRVETIACDSVVHGFEQTLDGVYPRVVRPLE